MEKLLAKRGHIDPRVKLLMTLPGVSQHTAQALLAAIGDISRFPNADALASYLGLVPSTRQSASHCYHGHITKQGRCHTRSMLIHQRGAVSLRHPACHQDQVAETAGPGHRPKAPHRTCPREETSNEGPRWKPPDEAVGHGVRNRRSPCGLSSTRRRTTAPGRAEAGDIRRQPATGARHSATHTEESDCRQRSIAGAAPETRCQESRPARLGPEAAIRPARSLRLRPSQPIRAAGDRAAPRLPGTSKIAPFILQTG